MSHEQRGVEAERLLANPLLAEAFQIIETRLINEMAQVEIKAERAEYLRQLITMGRKYKAYLEQVVVTGTLTVLEEQRKQTLMERARGGLRSII